MQAHTYSKAIPKLTIGIDLGDRRSRIYVIDAEGERVGEAWVGMTRVEWIKALARYAGARVATEAGTHSRWVSQLLEELGHEVIVANPSELYGRKRRKRRNDKLDAEKLARLARVDPALLYPIRHRGDGAQTDLAVVQSRDMLVQTRSKLINHVRGSVKPFGERIPKCSAESFVNRATEVMTDALRPALGPVLEQIRMLTEQIRAFDKQIEARAKEAYPETERLRQIKGVGPLTSLVYVLVVEDPKHFPVPREVASYAGLVPRLDETGESSPQLRITKAGNELMRRTLVQAAHFILGPFGPDTDLRRWGLSLMARGGKNAKKRAVVAVARKLSVVLHRLWDTGADYVPLREASENSGGDDAPIGAVASVGEGVAVDTAA